MIKNINELEKRIGYTFKNKDLLTLAVTHSSYSNEHKGKSYERLEFLGDSVLGFVTAEYLFKNYPNLPEGQLTKNRASLVCEKSLFEFSQKKYSCRSRSIKIKRLGDTFRKKAIKKEAHRSEPLLLWFYTV